MSADRPNLGGGLSCPVLLDSSSTIQLAHGGGGRMTQRLVDELFVTLAPLLAGNAHAPRIVEGPDLPDPLGLTLEWVLHHDDELYLRYHVRHDG